ncbi:hypothetical protein DPMN_087744 [Dreissena polymorpha]|uniref:Paraneoplastic antigen Ma-like C-terminal domain-containing protein n=1 Tax=Dreissena polymorpha TaxID=45954 RepID=A0A9D4KTR1_DREPO|nr:hypothetical protein DPMN_087744 [Dreissena polymorpha]
MAQAISKRELRCIRRERIREEILKEEQELKERRIKERIERELRSELSDEQDSIVSNMNTIDDYLQEESINGVEHILMNEKSTDCFETQLNGNTPDSLRYLDEHMRKLDVTLRELKYEDRKREDKTYVSSADHIHTRIRDTSSIVADRNSGIEERLSNRVVDTRLSRNETGSAHKYELKEDIRRVQNEYAEIRSQSEKYEIKNCQLMKSREDEERSHRMLVLENEFERKRQAEKELLRNIEQLELQERALLQQRSRNELLDREIAVRRMKDDDMNRRLEVLKQKERVLKDKVQQKNDNYMIREVTTNDQIKLSTRIPTLPSFDGKNFEEWKLETVCMMRTGLYSDYAVSQAIRNSLKGDTRRILLTIKPSESAEELIAKMTENFGEVKSVERIVQEFYSAKQHETESCSAWGIRLEALFQQAVNKGEIEERKRDNKLKERFWRGLNSEQLKAATRVSYESSDSFEKLKRKTRLEEEENNQVNATGKTLVNQQSTDDRLKVLDEMLERLKTIEAQMSNMKKHNLEGKREYESYEATKSSDQERRQDRHTNGGRYYRGGYRRGRYPNRGQTRYHNQEYESTAENKHSHLNEKSLSRQGTMEAKQN